MRAAPARSTARTRGQRRVSNWAMAACSTRARAIGVAGAQDGGQLVEQGAELGGLLGGEGEGLDEERGMRGIHRRRAQTCLL